MGRRFVCFDTMEDDHSHHDHSHHDHDVSSVGAAIVTVSSTRTLEDDPAGDAISAVLADHGHEVIRRKLVDDDFDAVQRIVTNLVDQRGIDVLITTGGTGVTVDDVTIEAVTPLFDRELPGFGELFRHLSYEEIGTRVIATRATAGVVEGAVVFCLPGSEHAARFGTEQLVVPEVGHLVGLATRHA